MLSINTGFEVLSPATVESAVRRVLLQLYLAQLLPVEPVTDLNPDRKRTEYGNLSALCQWRTGDRFGRGL